jgi:hypothetical protein
MSDRKVFFCYSDDGGHTWSSWRERSLGEQGEHEKRVRFNRLGSFRARIWRIRVSSPIKRDLLGAVGQFIETSG